MQNSEPKKRKTLALALSGCAGRAIAYIGFLEVFQENGIPVDAISACSSATIIAAAYGSGKLQELKRKLMTLSRKELFDMFEPSFKGGIFSLDRAENIFKEFIPYENLEDLNLPVSMVASDLVEGKEIIFSMGNIMRAVKASCSLPGIFEPVTWGGKVLIDGGLFSIIPVEAAKKYNMDVVIGIDMAATRRLFDPPLVNFKLGYNFFKYPFSKMRQLYGKLWQYIFGEAKRGVVHIDDIKSPNLLSVVGTALDYAIEERKKEERFDCDLLIEPDVKHYGKYEEESIETIYNEGRRSALAALPQIRKLLGIKAKVVAK